MKTKNKAFLSALHARLKGNIYYILINFPNRLVKKNASAVNLEIELTDAEDISQVEGYTDGKKIFAKGTPKLISGITFHELGHLLYTWFRGSRLLFDSIVAGEGIPDDLIHHSMSKYHLSVVQNDLKDDKRWAQYFMRSVLRFSNIVEDGHLERNLLSQFKVVLVSALIYTREFFWVNDIVTVQEIQDSIDAEEITETMGLWSLFLSYGKYGKIKRAHDDELKLPIMEVFKKYSDEYLDLVKHPKKVDRFKLTIKFYLDHLYDTVKAEYEEIKEKEDNGEDTPESTGGSTEESGEGSEGTSSGGMSLPGETTAPMGSSPFDEEDIDSEGSEDSSGAKAKAKGDSERHKIPFSDEDYTGKSGKLEELTSEEGGRIDNSDEGIAEGSSSPGKSGTDEEAYQEAEKDMDDFLKRIEDLAEIERRKGSESSTLEKGKLTDSKISDKITDTVSAHKGFSVNIHESREYRSEYERIFDTVGDYVMDTSKRLRSLFDMLARDYTKRGLWYGGKLNFRTAYRPEVGYYERDILNNPQADLALFVLVDESGSMSWGDRIPAAVRASVLLDAVAREINIPCAIYGHTEDSASRIEMYKYRDFDDPEEAKYTIPSMSARGNNRDGYAIRFALEKLKDRPEEKKLLIVISDGQPAAAAYHGQLAIRDMQNTIEEFKGIDVIAAAIGSDIEVIEEIYGTRNCLDCSDLSTVGDRLVRVLREASVR